MTELHDKIYDLFSDALKDIDIKLVKEGFSSAEIRSEIIGCMAFFGPMIINKSVPKRDRPMGMIEWLRICQKGVNVWLLDEPEDKKI